MKTWSWVAAAAAVGLAAIPAAAEPVRMSEMTREQEVVMQRGAPYPTLMCMLNLIDEIKETN